MKHQGADAAIEDGVVGDRIGFLIHGRETINHLGPVWDLLPPGSFDIVIYNQAEEPVADIEAKCGKWRCDVVYTDDLLNSGRRYRYLVSLHPIDPKPRAAHGGKPLIKLIGEKNIRFMYSAGKLRHNLSAWNSWYEMILCFGPFHAAAFAKTTKALIIQMGYPRLDGFFNDPSDRLEIMRRFNCDPGKQTVVWLPTWSTLSSIPLFHEEIGALASRYNVVVKVHPFTALMEADRLDMLKRHNLACIIADPIDNQPLYRLADFMLFDYGGPAFAAVYTDRNILLLNVPGAETDKLTGEYSPELLLRKHMPSANANEDSIARILADADLWAEQKSVRQSLRRSFFAPHYGYSSQVAAQAFMHLRHMLG